MQDVNAYWQGKSERADKARKHYEEMEYRYIQEIKESYSGTVIYDDSVDKLIKPVSGYKTQIEVKPLDVIAAAKEAGPHCGILNFASYKKPGGEFLNGSCAQEESICHGTTLYNVLFRCRGFYTKNVTDLNRSLYRNRALYSPGIIIPGEGSKDLVASVLTCAAPNYSAAEKYCNISRYENSKALRSRIDFVLGCFAENEVKTLILGAYGCGVFKQDPKEVAKIFSDYLTGKYSGVFERVVFAVPDDGKSNNYGVFRDAFSCP